MRKAEPLCAENIGLKDIARRRRGWGLIMYNTHPVLNRQYQNG